MAAGRNVIGILGPAAVGLGFFVPTVPAAGFPTGPTGAFVPIISDSIAVGQRTVYAQALFNPIPPPVVAVAVPQGWRSQTSIASPVAQAISQQPFVPFDTPQINTVTIDKWQQPLSGAPAVAIVNQGALTFVVPPFAVPQGWQSQIPLAPAVAQAISQQPFVPFNTRQTNTQTIDKWQQPLAGAPPVMQAQPGWSFVPLNTRQVNTVTIDKWGQPLSVPAPVAQSIYTATIGPLGPPVVAIVQPVDGWRPITSDQVKSAQAISTQATTFAVPPSPANNIVGTGWYRPLSEPAAVARAQPGWTFVPFNTPQVAAVTPLFGWQIIQSAAPLVAKAQAGWTFVPFDTVQQLPVFVPLAYEAASYTAVTVYYQASVNPIPPPPAPVITIVAGWMSQTNLAAVTARSIPTQATTFAVPPNPSNTIVGIGWFQKLSQAAPVAQAIPTQPNVPYNAPQIIVQPSAGWWQPLSKATQVVQAQPGWTFVPFNTPQIVVAPPSGWQQPLSTAVATAKAFAGQITLSYQVQVVQPPAGWAGQANSPAFVVQPVPTQATNFAVPSAAVIANTVAGISWYQPLSKPAAVAISQAGWIFVPFNTVQVIPVVTVTFDPFVEEKAWRKLKRRLEQRQKALFDQDLERNRNIKNAIAAAIRHNDVPDELAAKAEEIRQTIPSKADIGDLGGVARQLLQLDLNLRQAQREWLIMAAIEWERQDEEDIEMLLMGL